MPCSRCASPDTRRDILGHPLLASIDFLTTYIKMKRPYTRQLDLATLASTAMGGGRFRGSGYWTVQKKKSEGANAITGQRSKTWRTLKKLLFLFDAVLGAFRSVF